MCVLVGWLLLLLLVAVVVVISKLHGANGVVWKICVSCSEPSNAPSKNYVLFDNLY